MYGLGDMVFYSSTGVCEIVGVGAVEGMPAGKEFYTLCPVSTSHREMIYVPVDIQKGLRRAISGEDANNFIEMIKTIEPVAPTSRNPKAISDFYSRLISTYDCKNLLTVIVSLTLKKRECEEKKKRLNQTQASFLFKACEMIYNEFALALNISKQEVEALIARQMDNF